MKITNWILALLALATFSMSGCNDTAQGALEDTEENTEAIGEATEAAAEEIEETAEAVSASTLTTRIKTALVADPVTNEDNIEINVESTEETVTLHGYVQTQDQKDRAHETAQTILDEVDATQTLVNDLEVREM